MRALLTTEINNSASPVRRFLDERFTVGLREVQRRYPETVPPLGAPPASADVDSGNLGTAANWLLRFLLDSQPDLTSAVRGAGLSASADLDITPTGTDLADRLGASAPKPGSPARVLPGPGPGTDAAPDLLARACWAFALLTEAAQRAPFVPAQRQRTLISRSTPTGSGLLGVAPPTALKQLSALREVFEQSLIPQLAQRGGPWALGSAFSSSQPLKSDADVIAAGLLLNLTTSTTGSTLGLPDVFQLIGCALLDFDDTRRPDSLGARHRHLVTWELDLLLAEQTGKPVLLPTLRVQFRTLLLADRHC